MVAKEWIQFRFQPKAALLFFLAFVLFTIIGTLSHEVGHIAVAKTLGYRTTLSYGSMNYTSELRDSMKRIYQDNFEAINNDLDFTERERYDAMVDQYLRGRFLVTLGGPIQTMLTGCLGMMLLYWRRKRREFHSFHFWDWTAVFLSLFWLRETFNMLTGLMGSLINNPAKQSGMLSDEVKLAGHLQMPDESISIALGLLALAISCWVIFKVIPVRFRFTFILSGMLGGLFGFWFWFNLAGPALFN